ncbi:signal peptidase 22kDa subunit [Choanephora cucurbitarum]|nr:signal peptidase 22kDa subunit [Choanephora cucurbitarum]
MHNLQQRANTLFSFATSVIAVVLGVVALISYITGYGNVQPHLLAADKSSLSVVTRRYGPDNTDYRNSKSEFARLLFDIDADFTPMFNWNTKQVFVTVVAEYENDYFGRNHVVIWDKIITGKDKAHLKLRHVRNKYALIDVSQRWNAEKVNLTLYWDVTPYVGLLQHGRQSSVPTEFKIPSLAKQ